MASPPLLGHGGRHGRRHADGGPGESDADEVRLGPGGGGGQRQRQRGAKNGGHGEDQGLLRLGNPMKVSTDNGS